MHIHMRKILIFFFKQYRKSKQLEIPSSTKFHSRRSFHISPYSNISDKETKHDISIFIDDSLNQSLITNKEDFVEDYLLEINQEKADKKICSIFDSYKSTKRSKPIFDVKMSVKRPLFNQNEREQYRLTVLQAEEDLKRLKIDSDKINVTPIFSRSVYPKKPTLNLNEISNNRKSQEHKDRLNWFDLLVQQTETSHEKNLKSLPSLKIGHFLKKKLTSTDETLYNDLIYNTPSTKSIISCNNGQIHGKDLQTLSPGAWLNDEVINFFLKLLRNTTNGCYSHSTYFLPTLMSNQSRTYNYRNVSRWTKRGKNKCDLFSQRYVFIPVNMTNTHWTVVVVNIEKKIISYYDSMGGSGSQYLKTILKYLKDEKLDKLKENLNEDQWKLIDMRDTIPQQQNGYDCGMFMLCYCYFISFDSELEFSQQDMLYFRKRFCIDIATNKIGSITKN